MKKEHRNKTILGFILTLLALACLATGCGSKKIPEGRRETRGRFTLVWLHGTPYEMGYQQGKLLHTELKAALDYINNDIVLSNMETVAKSMGILDLAYSNSYPDVLEECRGLTDATRDIGFTMDKCLVLNFGDVLMEFILDGMPTKKYQPGCSGIIVSGGATPDGKLYHGRILDWDKIQYILDYPVIFIRKPSDGIAHAYIGFPANLSPYQGINAAGISVSSNEAHPFDQSHHDLTGRSHVQMLGQILKKTRTLEEVKTYIKNEDHMTTEIFVVADGNNKAGAIFEMTAKVVGIRELNSDGLVYVTNHFLAPEAKNADKEPTKEANLLRYDRLEQLLKPQGHADSLYGQLDPAGVIKVMRDRINPWDGTESPLSEFDNGKSLATYGALFQIVFDPKNLFFWVAAGALPVPQQTFVGFSLGELLGLPGAKPVTPASYQ